MSIGVASFLNEKTARVPRPTVGGDQACLRRALRPFDILLVFTDIYSYARTDD
jgi:hypothetical protein